MYSYRSFALALAVVTCICSCHRTTKSTHKAASSADTTQTVAKKPLTALPDTMYASVANMRYWVNLVDGEKQQLGTLTSLYDDDNIYTFRKNLFRDADFGGRVKGTPSVVDTAWVFHTYYNTEQTKYGVWGGGSGWTGQPLYNKRKNEVMVGSLCGRVYFIDYTTGKASQPAVDVVNTIKGTPSLDPELPNLYVGQGVPNHLPFGSLVIDLDKHQQTCFFDRDPYALRGWNAFDSSPVVVGGFLFWPGENGCLYKMRRSKGKLTKVATLRYTVNGSAPVSRTASASMPTMVSSVTIMATSLPSISIR